MSSNTINIKGMVEIRHCYAVTGCCDLTQDGKEAKVRSSSKPSHTVTSISTAETVASQLTTLNAYICVLFGVEQVIELQLDMP